MKRSRITRSAGAMVIAACLLALVAPSSMSAAASASTRPLTFVAAIGSHCVGGSASDNAAIALTWKSAAGALKAKASVHASSADGTWEYCTTGSPVVQIGDSVKASDGTTTRKFQVPDLTVVQNRVAAQYHGRGPAGDYIRVFCRAPLAGEFEPCLDSWKVKVSSTGLWSLSMSSRSVLGGDRVRVHWTSTAGDKVEASSIAPYIAVTIGRAAFTGYANGSVVNVQLRDGTTNALLATGAASRNGDGSFAGKFTDAQGHKVTVALGDRVVADIATNADFSVFDMSAQAFSAGNSQAGEISGECPYDPYDVNNPTSGAVVAYQYRNGVLLDFTDGTLADDGSFDMHALYFTSTDKILVGCQLTTGDFVQTWAAVDPSV